MVFGYYNSHPKALTPTLSQRERAYSLSLWEKVRVRARKTENHYGLLV